MKKITILTTVIISAFVVTSCNNSNATSKINNNNLEKAKTRDLEIKKGAASISFDKTEYNFGTVNEGDVVETTFKVTNSGETDLVITNAEPSCGCTVPEWPKEPIKPWESADVLVKFNTSGKPNRQTKTITLTTNTEAGRQVLTLKGSVIPKPKK
ncbi:MAG: DUF1573 domain-containing protein [Polaribacter sp.]